MSGSATTFRASRWLLPEYITRGQDNVVACPVYKGTSLDAPASGTGTVYDRAGNVVYTAAVSVASSVASITIPAASLPTTLSLERGWAVRFELTFSDSTKETFQNSAYLVRSELNPVITDADLFARHSALDPFGNAPLTSKSSFAVYRDEAWVDLVTRITSKGSLPHLITEPTALRKPHLLHSLELLFEDLATTLAEAYSEKAAMYREKYDAAFDELVFDYDADQDGLTDGPRKRSARSSVWLC